MILKEFETFMMFQPGQESSLSEYLSMYARHTSEDDFFELLAGGSVLTAVSWAEVEDRNPEHVRLFFLEDFVLQPEVAARGLANFLGVSSISNASETVFANV